MNATELDPDDASFDDELAAARAITQYHYVNTADHGLAAYLAPHDETTLDDNRIETLAWAMYPTMSVFHNTIKSKQLDDADGAAPRGPRTDRTFLFDAHLDNAEADDDTDLTFEVVATFQNSYNDDRVAVETPAPWNVPDDHNGDPPNDVVKALPWGDDDADDDEQPAHYTFEANDHAAPAAARDEAWVLDADAAPALREAAADNGYTWTDLDDTADESGEAATFTDLITFINEGDRVHVHYEKKNGNGTNTYSGVALDHSRIQTSQTNSYEDWDMVFEDDDGKTKCVKLDDNGQAGLFSNSHYPFMGEVHHVTVTPATEQWPDMNPDNGPGR